MSLNIGEFECKLDAKGRFRIPTNLLRKYEEGMEFVINRGFEGCLNLYPKPVWDEMAAKVSQLNPYIKKNRQFIRFVHRGASEAKPDSSDRILLTKLQMEHASITKEIVLEVVGTYIEVWDKTRYKQEMLKDMEDTEGMSETAEEVSQYLGYPDQKKKETDE